MGRDDLGARTHAGEGARGVGWTLGAVLLAGAGLLGVAVLAVAGSAAEEASGGPGALPRAAESLDRLAEKDGPFAGQVLTPAQVEEQRVQLTELMRRAWVDLPNDPGLTRPWGMTVTYIGESGQMMVNAYTHQYNSIGPGNDDRPERHLWMTVDPE